MRTPFPGRAWPAVRAGLRAWALCVLTLTSAEAAAPPTATAPKALTLADELSSLATQVAEARAVFDTRIALRPESALDLLTQAQVAYLDEDYPRAVARLLDLTARPEFQAGPAYAEALGWLAESLGQLGLPRAAAQELRRAVAAPAEPAIHRRLVSRYLVLAAPLDPLEAVRAVWARYQQGRAEGDLTAEDRDIRYLYAKALLRGGALGEARTLLSLSAASTDDAHALQAQYMLGVALVMEDDLKGARAAFETGLSAWRAAKSPPPDAEPPEYWDVEPGSGPALSISALDGDSVDEADRGDDGADATDAAPSAAPVVPLAPAALAALDEAEQHRRRLGEAFHLALARLDATRDNLGAAIQHYRGVAPGSPDAPAATQEMVWALFRRGEFARAARVVDQLLAGRGDDRTAAELFIWKAHLLALSADYEGARRNYQALETSLDRRRAELEGELARDSRVFPEAVLAWSPPRVAAGARHVEAELVECEEELAEADETASTLRFLLESAELLPGVRNGKGLHAILTAKLAAFRERVVAAAAAPERARLTALGAPPAELLASTDRLAERMARLAVALDEAETRWRTRLVEVLGEESPALAVERRGLEELTGRARTLGMALADAAVDRLRDSAADAHFRQIDIAWWRVDEVRRRISGAQDERREVLRPMREEVEDFRRERRDDPIPGFEEPEEAR